MYFNEQNLFYVVLALHIIFYIPFHKIYRMLQFTHKTLNFLTLNPKIYGAKPYNPQEYKPFYIVCERRPHIAKL